MPLEIKIRICDRGSQIIEVAGNKRLALHHGADVVATIAGMMDEMALTAAKHVIDDQVLPEQLRKAQ